MNTEQTSKNIFTYMWEKMLYPGQKMGCLSHGGYSSGESGVRMVYEF